MGGCGAAARPGQSRRFRGVANTQALAELSGSNQTEAFTAGDALTNATLLQFDVPSSLNASAVLGELLQELDLDLDELADGARDAIETGVAQHLAHRALGRATALAAAASELHAMLMPAPASGAAAAAVAAELPAGAALKAEALVARLLAQLPAPLTTDEDALAQLLEALELPQQGLSAAEGAGGGVLPPRLLRLLRDATATYCAGLRRQAARETALTALGKLLVPDSLSDDPLGQDGSEGSGEVEAEAEAEAEAGAAAAAAAAPTWEQASGLVGEVYAGFEEQARGMSPIDLLLDLLRMAAVDEEALRKGERRQLEEAVQAFSKGLRQHDALAKSARPLALRAAATDAEGGTEAEALAGWRAVDPAHRWARLPVGELLEHGGDASDFALALASLVHGMGGRVRLLHMCSPPSAASGGSGTPGERRCQLIAEASLGKQLEAAARWVGRRQLLRAATAGSEPPRLHLRRDTAGVAWLGLAWGAALPQGGQLPGATSYGSDGGGGVGGGAPTADERASWRTYRPFDEHGCAWRDEDSVDMQTGQRLPPDELLSIAVPLTD
jgi:hypothetical protein